MIKGSVAFAFFAAILVGATMVRGADPLPPPSAMTLDQLREATVKNLAVVNAIQREILRRYPETRPFEGYDPRQAAAVSPEVERQIRAMTDEQTVEALATGSARLEALATEGSRRIAGQSTPRGAPPVGAQPLPDIAPANETKNYCKAMYGKAYMLCGREDRSCKFLAASHWEECEKTGRWRD